jgi:hypothetical protein
MIVTSRIGQSMVAGFGAFLLTVAAVGGAIGPVRAEASRPMAGAPAGLVAAPLSSQAAA